MVTAGHPEKINFPTVDCRLLTCLVVVFILNFTCDIQFFIHITCTGILIIPDLLTQENQAVLVVHVCTS